MVAWEGGLWHYALLRSLPSLQDSSLNLQEFPTLELASLVPNLAKTEGTFGILIQSGRDNYKMAASVAGPS